MHEEMLNALRRNGHKVGTQSAISHDGKLLLSVDGRLMTLPDIHKLLDEDEKKSQA